MYLLIDEDGKLTEVDELPGMSGDCWPKVIEIKIYSDTDCEAFELTKDGWKAI